MVQAITIALVFLAGVGSGWYLYRRYGGKSATGEKPTGAEGSAKAPAGGGMRVTPGVAAPAVKGGQNAVEP